MRVAHAVEIDGQPRDQGPPKSSFWDGLRPTEEEIAEGLKKPTIYGLDRQDVVNALTYEKLKKRYPHQPPKQGPQILTPEQVDGNYDWIISNWGDICSDRQIARLIRAQWLSSGRTFPWHPSESQATIAPSGIEHAAESGGHKNPAGKRCRRCDSEYHLVKECPLQPKEAGVRSKGDRGSRGGSSRDFGRDFGEAWRIAKGRK